MAVELSEGLGRTFATATYALLLDALLGIGKPEPTGRDCPWNGQPPPLTTRQGPADKPDQAAEGEKGEQEEQAPHGKWKPERQNHSISAKLKPA